ncbi:hypothetical protein L596_028507 [Steinernema carpocapsae]|uniref:Uncharacterized protein n=1 Tax=Steinernema carpocapsae TaxID=34508 RepID=A0A4U5LYR3_STECR|nr:hypothetical protein L596_028507 [Steinernema carpocapsae]
MAGYRMPTPETMPDSMCVLMKNLDNINKDFNDDDAPNTANSARLEPMPECTSPGRSLSKMLGILPSSSTTKKAASSPGIIPAPLHRRPTALQAFTWGFVVPKLANVHRSYV